MTLAGKTLITRFEGFRAEAYADPLYGWDVPTIGFGTTRYADGSPVKKGDSISEERALAELEHYVNTKIRPALAEIPGWGEMSEQQQGALESFAYNLGEGFFGAPGFDTITNRLKNRRWDLIPDALLLYRNPGSVVEAGLMARRKAEGAVWREGLKTAPPTKKTELYYHKGYFHHDEGVVILPDGTKVRDGYVAIMLRDGKPVGLKISGSTDGDRILPLDPKLVLAFDWQIVTEENLPNRMAGSTKLVPPVAIPTGEIRLSVPMFSQRDSRFLDQRDRSCFSSSMAMLVEFFKPGTLGGGPNADDVYLEYANAGSRDTTLQGSQIAALKHFGLTGEFQNDLAWKDVQAELKAGRPMGIGLYHNGPNVNPHRDSGHWLVIRGMKADGSAYMVNDPYGEMDLVNGGYPWGAARSGNGLWYSEINLSRRWLADGPGTGWGVRIIT